MKSTMIKTGLLIIVFSLSWVSAFSQGAILRRVQQKTEEKIVNKIFGEDDANKQNENTQTSPESNNSPQNRRGSGLSQNAPDVLENIKLAKETFDGAKYIQAKSAVRNALWGVELEIGKKVLESLPKSVEGCDYQTSEDKVSSAGAGWVGMTIERVYQGKNDKQLRATIGNDSALLGMAGFYMTDGVYTQSSDQPDQKQIQFKDHRAVIRYNEYDGYTLSVPFGQSSVFVFNGVNFDNENQFMAAANNFDIVSIKKELGEQ
jgi:hypothetical protein